MLPWHGLILEKAERMSFIIPVGIGGLVAFICLIVAFRYLRCKRLIDDLPTSKTQGVFIGLAELKGTAESEKPLISYLAEIKCVLYNWHIEESWSRTVMETYTDSKGHTSVRPRRESGMTTVAKGGESAPFFLQDDVGVIRILPEGAKIEDTVTFDKTFTHADALYFGKGPLQEVPNSDHRRHFQETAIPLHSTLYVMGQAREREDVVAPEIAHDKQAPMFLISTRTEKQVSAGFGRWYWFWLALGLVAAVGGIGIADLLEGFDSASRWQPYTIATAGFIIVLGVGWGWTVYNSLVNLRQRVRQAWSEVDVQLKRRNDLIPNLVQVVEGYRTHELETQKLIAELRGQLTTTLPGVAGPDPRGCAQQLRLIVEKYPELKASEVFLKLQQGLSDMEQRIALARDYFNQIATFYDIRLAIIPDRFVAVIARLHPQPLIVATDFERAEVKIKLVS